MKYLIGVQKESMGTKSFFTTSELHEPVDAPHIFISFTSRIWEGLIKKHFINIFFFIEYQKKYKLTTSSRNLGGKLM